MSRFIKYLILCLAVSLFADASQSLPYLSDNESVDNSLIYSEVSASLSETDNDLCLHRQASSTSHANIQYNTRRNDSSQRQILEFVKSGKVVNPTLRYNLLVSSINNRSSFSDPAFMLVRICKFII